MKKIIYTLFLTLLSLGVQAKGVPFYHKVEINNTTESRAVEYAIKGFTDDLNRKFGSADLLNDKPVIRVNLEITADSKEFDKYTIQIKKGEITFTGSDELGLIHGIYSFSEQMLGIDPFIHYTHIMPELVDQIEIPAGTIKSKPYTYTHRGFFLNDEDLITGFQLEKIQYGFNLEFMEMIYETMLRAKMTCVIPSTLVLADEPHLALASDMGLYITQHHAEPLGSVPLYWPKNEPYSWSTNRDAFIKFWSTAIERQKGRNVIWTLGFRGLLDRDFWADDPAFTSESTDEDKAKVINEVIETQYELIKKITKNPDPLVTGNLRGDVSRLYNLGLIKYPPKTMIQFTDSDGKFAPTTWEDAKKCPYPKGVYQHVSLHNRRAYIRVNILDPNMLCEQMQMAYDHDMTSICVLNVGNLKEKIFGVQQMVNYMNDFESFADQKSDEYYQWYVNDKYGMKSEVIAKTYRDFIHNHFKMGKNIRVMGDEYYSFATESLLRMVCEKDKVSAKLPKEWGMQIAKLEGFDAKFLKLLDLYTTSLEPAVKNWETSMYRALDARSALSGNREEFYNVDLVYPTQKLYHLTSMLNDLSNAMKAYMAKDYHEAQAQTYQALRHVDKALEMEQKIEAAFAGEFEDWYRFDQNARTWAIKEHLTLFHSMCTNLKYLSLPYSQRNSKTESIQYKKEPFFKSQYNGELIYMENAQ